MYLLAPFIVQSLFKKSYSWFRVVRISTIFTTKMAHLSWTKFFLVQTIVITFIYLLALFIVQNLKKFLQRVQNFDDALFFGPKRSIWLKQTFLWGKIIIIILIYLLAPFIVQNLKKFFQQIQSYKDAHFPKLELFQKICLRALFLLFMRIYMPKIKVRYWSISEIMMIKEYWNLIGREPFLSLTSELDFSQACSFHRMLMDHKNFDFTQIQDKNKNVIPLKSQKIMFLGQFWPF